MRITAKNWYKNNKALTISRTRQWEQDHPEASKIMKNTISKQWMAKHPGIAAERTMKQKAKRLKRIPLWADLNSIKSFYRKSPEGHEVDHIIPLQGKHVSGLHVLNNLQYLPIKDNQIKSNKYVCSCCH
jgi:hypothetical protein